MCTSPAITREYLHHTSQPTHSTGIETKEHSLNRLGITQRPARRSRRNDPHERVDELAEIEVDGCTAEVGLGGELPTLQARGVVGGGDGGQVEGWGLGGDAEEVKEHDG